jgi:adenylate kinase family enzyme
MKKVLVIGPGGAGKSTLSNRLGELLSIDVLHLDKHYWHPGWVETPKPEWRKAVEGLVKHDEWIMDGNYSGTFDIRFEACDTVIFLDMPRGVCLWRVLKRGIKYRDRSRPDMADGCPERLNWKFLVWIWNYPNGTRRKVVKMLESAPGDKSVIWLRSRREVEEFLKTRQAVRSSCESAAASLTVD